MASQGSGMLHTICQLLSVSRHKPFIHPSDAPSSLLEISSLLWHFCHIKLYPQSFTHISWRHGKHQKHPHWVHPHQEERPRRWGVRPDLYLTVSAGFSIVICRGQQGERGREVGAIHTLPCSSTAHSSHSLEVVTLLWPPAAQEKQLSPHFMGKNGRAWRTKAIINYHLLKGGCSCFERFSCKLCRSAQNFNGCLPTKACHWKSKMFPSKHGVNTISV